MIPSKKKKVHQRVHHYTLSTTQTRTLIRVDSWFPIRVIRSPALCVLRVSAVQSAVAFLCAFAVQHCWVTARSAWLEYTDIAMHISSSLWTTLYYPQITQIFTDSLVFHLRESA